MIKHSFGTHDGSFHADEVTACALLLNTGSIDRDKVFRTREKDVLKNLEYICDVGGVYDPINKLFDHHQQEYEGDLSSAGMVLNYLKDKKVISKDLFAYLNETLVKGVDAIDNGNIPAEVEGVCTFSAVIAHFVPVDQETDAEGLDAAFFDAVDFASGHISRLIEKFDYIKSCRSLIEQEMKKNNPVLFFNKPIPWIESFFELNGDSHPAKYIIMPAGKHWKLRGIPPTYKRRMEVRAPLPLSWAGLIDKDLKRVTQIPGAIFCHKGRFISVWESKEDAIKAVEIVLKRNL